MGDPTYVETFGQYIRMTVIFTDFSDVNNRVTHFLMEKFQKNL